MAKQGGRLLAVSTDTVAQAREVVDKGRLNFALLSDPEATIIRRFGLVHAGGNPSGGVTAIPAQFLLSKDGTVAWRYVSGRVTERADVENIMAQIRTLGGSK